MTNAALTSVLTRCLLDAAFLEQFARDGEAALKGCGLSAEDRAQLARLDVERIRRFSGFITKVKHNDLWEHFPYTRLLMRRLGLELEVFTVYRHEHQRLQAEGRQDRWARIDRFLAFLDRHLGELGGPGAAALADVARHERLLWEVHCELAFRPEAADEAPRVDPERHRPGALVPRPRGALRVGRFTHHPLELIAATAERRLDPERLDPRRRWLAYLVGEKREGGGREIQVLEVDASAAALLAAIDGERSLGEIFAAVLPGEQAAVRDDAARSFLDSLRELDAFSFTGV
jgi:hypothetical protein